MSRRDVVVAGLVLLVAVTLLAPVATLGVDPHHDGIMLKPALDVLSGQALFRDTFTQYGALTTYLQVAVLAINPTLAALRFTTVAAYALTLVFLYAAWRTILPRPLAALSCGLLLLFIPVYEKNWLNDYWLMLPWSSVYALMFQALALCALLNIIRDQGAARWGAVLGAACACILWCRQPVGVVTTGCVAVCWFALWATGWTPVQTLRMVIARRVLAGFLIVNALLLASVVLTSAGPQWWYQNFVWPSRWAANYDSVSLPKYFSYFLRPAGGLLLVLVAALVPALVARRGVNWSPRLRAAYYAVLAALMVWQHERVFTWLGLRDSGWNVCLPLAVLVIALVYLALAVRKPAGPRPLEFYLVAALAATAGGALLQFYPVPDPLHAVWALAPGFGLIVWGFWRTAGWSPAVTTAALAALFLPAAIDKAGAVRLTLADTFVTIEQPALLRGMRVWPGKARNLGQITELLAKVEAQHPAMPSVLIGDDALYLCLLPNRTNPSPYYVTWRLLADDETNQERWAYIHRVRPLLFLHKARWDAVSDFYRRARYVPLLYVHEEALEIAVPQELADAMGLKVYGAAAPGAPKP